MISRREMLKRAGAGFGSVGLALAMQDRPHAAGATSPSSQFHFAPKAKRVIFLFMNGGPSHVDTFDPKPALAKHAGEHPSGKRMRASKGSGYLPSPFRFRPHGDSGVVMSELFPHMGRVADELCVLRSCHTDVPNHEPGLLLMNCGNQQPIRPCLGSWASYGLGTENQNLPAFVTLCPGLPVVGPQLWSNSFLPGEHQATRLDTRNMAVDKLIANLRHPSFTRPQQRAQLDMLREFNQLHADSRRNDPQLEAQIRAMELAFSMQREAEEAFDISQEPKHVQDAYGSSVFGKGTLLARRLVERGVRFVQVYDVDKGKQPWDTHKDNDGGHRRLCSYSDQATAALIDDLKHRGLLEDTLVIWGGEFGRTPTVELPKEGSNQGKINGRDHNHWGFSMWIAGGGIRGGHIHGATDEFGFKAEQDRVHVHDLHATLLHLLGFDHEKFTYRWAGRDFRLTDVHGRLIHDILA